MRIAHEIQETTPISFWESEEINTLFGENSQDYFRSMSRD